MFSIETAHELQTEGIICFTDLVAGLLPCEVAHTFAGKVWKQHQLEVTIFGHWEANHSRLRGNEKLGSVVC